MPPQLRERGVRRGRSEELDLHHCHPTRRAPVGTNTRGEVLRRPPARCGCLRTAQRSGGGRGGTSFPSTGHMVNALPCVLNTGRP
eukprot:312904-Prymnesium_polylepis.1